jgi:hypothetical protein
MVRHLVFVGQRRPAHEPIVGVEHDVQPATEILGEWVRFERRSGVGLDVTRQAYFEAMRRSLMYRGSVSR